MDQGENTAPVAAPGRMGFMGKAKMALMALLFAVGGWIGQDVYGMARDALLPGDDPIATLAEQQKAGFDELRASLDGLRGSVDREGQAAFKQVQRATADLERVNRDILAKLQFAQSENAAITRNLQETRGLSGGYDFLLSPQESMRIDAQNVVGLDRLTGDGAWVAITSGSSEDAERRGHIRTGGSLPFTNAGGQSCRVTLMSKREGIGAASFSIICDRSA